MHQRKERGLQRRKAEHEEAAVAAAKREDRLAREREAIKGKLEAAASPAKIAEIVVGNQEVLDKDSCKTAWKQLAQSGTIEPTHDIATVVGWGHFLICGWQDDPGWLWHEIGQRSHIWQASTVESVYIDREGTEWKPMPSLLRDIPKGPTFWRGIPNWVALPRGQSFRATACLQSLGLLVLPNAKARSVIGGAALSRTDLDDSAYARSVASMLHPVTQY